MKNLGTYPQLRIQIRVCKHPSGKERAYNRNGELVAERYREVCAFACIIPAAPRKNVSTSGCIMHRLCVVVNYYLV